MYPACSMCAKWRVYSSSCVRCTQTHHHRANHLRAWKDYLRVEKDYLRLEKTIYGPVEKDYLRLWPSFFRIVSLFLITGCTFNQSMNKNIWMPYVICDTPHKTQFRCSKPQNLKTQNLSELWNYFFEPDLVYYRINTPFRVYFRMRKFTFPRVFPHVEIPEKSCIPARFSPRKFTNPLVNWPAEIHFPAWISAYGNTPKTEYFRTLGNPQFLVYFHMRKCTISCEFPHGERRISAGADLHIVYFHMR